MDFQLSNQDSSSSKDNFELSEQRTTQVLAAYTEAGSSLQLAEKTSATAFFEASPELAPFLSEAKTRQVSMRDVVLAIVALTLGLCFIFGKNWRAIGTAGMAQNENFDIHPLSNMPPKYRQFEQPINEAISSEDFKQLRNHLMKALDYSSNDSKDFPPAILGCAFELLAKRKAEASSSETYDPLLADKARRKFEELQPQLDPAAMVARVYFECLRSVTPIVDWKAAGRRAPNERISPAELHTLRQDCMDLRPASLDAASKRRLGWVNATVILVELWIPAGVSDPQWEPKLSFDRNDTELQKKWNEVHNVLWDKFTPGDNDSGEWRTTRLGFWATLNSFCSNPFSNETIKVGSRTYKEKDIEEGAEKGNPQHPPPH